jgi:hypothetical protein
MMKNRYARIAAAIAGALVFLGSCSLGPLSNMLNPTDQNASSVKTAPISIKVAHVSPYVTQQIKAPLPGMDGVVSDKSAASKAFIVADWLHFNLYQWVGGVEVFQFGWDVHPQSALVNDPELPPVDVHQIPVGTGYFLRVSIFNDDSPL